MELERVVIASVSAVMEAAAVGLTPPGGGPEQLIMFLVLHQRPQSLQLAQQSPSTASSSKSQTCVAPEGQQGLLSGPEAGHSKDAIASNAAGSSLAGLWNAVRQAKEATAFAASNITNMAAMGIDGEAGAPAGQQQTASTSQQATDSEAGLHELKLKCQAAIRSSLNPLFKLERVLLRESLPRTASNKVMRRLLRDELRQTTAKL